MKSKALISDNGGFLLLGDVKLHWILNFGGEDSCLSCALTASVVTKTFRPKLLMLASAHSNALFVRHVQSQRLKIIVLIVAAN